jgi:hypothetical protein
VQGRASCRRCRWAATVRLVIQHREHLGVAADDMAALLDEDR